MTTPRPHPRAMDVQKELVKIVIHGIETAPDAPLPGEPQTGLWVPTLKVA